VHLWEEPPAADLRRLPREPRLDVHRRGGGAHLREQASADLFVCADSIAVGSRWHDTLVGELERRPTLVWLLSRRSSQSTFCSFEVGFATAAGKRVVIISLDGERPPSFAQHLHMIDVERRRATKPWLDPHEALADAVVEALVEAAAPTPVEVG
jgi:hypothetical protein